jgi:hypothetical protein
MLRLAGVVPFLLLFGACLQVSPPPVTAVSATVRPVSTSSGCPKTFDFNGSITASRAAQVRYRWERSDGSRSLEHTVHFARRGTATVRDTRTFRSTASGWQLLAVLGGSKAIRSGRATFSVTCPASVLGVLVRASPSSSTHCKQAFTFTGTLTSSGAGLVTYRWMRSDSSSTKPATLRFAGAGSRTVRDVWAPGGAPFTGWSELVVLRPNSLTSNRAKITKLARCK